MEDRYLFRAKGDTRYNSGEWYEGYLIKDKDGDFQIFRNSCRSTVLSETICRCTGRNDKNGKLIFENDITKLVLPNGEVRYFKVSFKKVIRKVLCHPDFDDDVAKVELNAICFVWNGYELFPCIDENGISDISKMEVVGNIFDNPELLER